MPRERRRHERWQIDEELHCYLDGERVDLRSENLSGGGMFLRTERPYPLGATVMLVFKKHFYSSGSPIFLFARVMRATSSPVSGLGLRWEKATSPASPDVLRDFLKCFLQVDGAELEYCPVGRTKAPHFVFRFPPDAIEMGSSDMEETQPDAPDAEPDDEEGRSRAPVEPPLPLDASAFPAPFRSAPPAVAVVPAAVESPPSGPLTQQVASGGACAPVRMPAVVWLRGKVYAGDVLALGLRKMLLEVHEAAPDPAEPFQVLLRIPRPSGPAAAYCDCVAEAAPPDEALVGLRGTLVTICRLDEPDAPGSFEAHVKKLYFDGMRRA
jgi:hypothetical protein